MTSAGSGRSCYTATGAVYLWQCLANFHQFRSICTWMPATKDSQFWIQIIAGFDINVRELFCAALAAILWGNAWTPSSSNNITHVRAWSDNASAVSWVNKLGADNEFGQELIRATGFSEATHRFRVSACHLPESINVVTDAGSRCPRWGSGTVQDVLHKLQAHALATGSHRKYESSWRQWTSWCRSEGLSPWLTGERAQDSEQLITFAMWCWRPRPGSRGNSAFTVVSKLSHISWYHRRYCGFSVGLHAGHQVAMQGMQRLSAPPSRKRSITVDLLRHLRARCDFQSARDRVLWGGAAVMGYFNMLWRSENIKQPGQHQTVRDPSTRHHVSGQGWHPNQFEGSSARNINSFSR
ncbi:hypothetical protein PI124_g21274 [Phytophthora idaei]|nr:hypothetical protein PI124_g21274 [Phytophthora idaei]